MNVKTSKTKAELLQIISKYKQYVLDFENEEIKNKNKIEELEKKIDRKRKQLQFERSKEYRNELEADFRKELAKYSSLQQSYKQDINQLENKIKVEQSNNLVTKMALLNYFETIISHFESEFLTHREKQRIAQIFKKEISIKIDATREQYFRKFPVLDDLPF